MAAVASERFRIINGVLIVAIALVVIAAVVNAVAVQMRSGVVPSRESIARGTNVKTPAPLATLEQYKTLFLAKKLFRPLITASVSREERVTIDDLTRDIMVIGVVQQDVPEAIIKNRRTRETYFVKKGNSLGRLTVESITDDKVEVSYEGSRKTLFIQ